MKISEDTLCNTLASSLVENGAVRRWFLFKSGFGQRASAVLLWEEQSERPAVAWWRHWWGTLPDGSESETDLFAVFSDDAGRFAVHVECKMANGRFRPRQAEDYRRRADHWLENPKYLNHTVARTVLLAPASFIATFAVEAGAFDHQITFEELGELIPNFHSF